MGGWAMRLREGGYEIATGVYEMDFGCLCN